MDGHDAVAYLGKTQIPGVAEGILEGVTGWSCDAPLSVWSLGLGQSIVSLQETLGKEGGDKNMFLPLSLLINAVLFKLLQYLPCNKASQYVDVLLRVQPLSRKQFSNSWGRDGWPPRAKAGWGGRICTALCLPCLQLSLWAGSHVVTCSIPLLLPICLCTFCLFYMVYTHLSLWIRTCTNHRSWNLLPVFESICYVLCIVFLNNP